MFNETNIQNEIQAIKERNQRVEMDKKWETSWIRRIFITLITYVIAGIWLVLINDTYPWLKAFVPTGGYVLSMLSLPFIKRWWIKKRLKK